MKIVSSEDFQKQRGLGFQSLKMTLAAAYRSQCPIHSRRITTGAGNVADESASVIPVPDYETLKALLMTTPRGRSFDYQYLSGPKTILLRPDDYYLLRTPQVSKAEDDVILIPRRAAEEVSRYITDILIEKKKGKPLKESSASRGTTTAAGAPQPPFVNELTLRRKEERLEEERRAMESLADFRAGFPEEGETSAIRLSALVMDVGHSEATAKITVNRMKEALRRSGVFDGKRLTRSNFYISGEDIWVGGTSRQALQNYFIIETPRTTLERIAKPGKTFDGVNAGDSQRR